MATATLNDVTTSLLTLNEEQGKTTEAVTSLVKRFQSMIDMQKRDALDKAEAARERKTAAAKSPVGRAPQDNIAPFSILEKLLGGAALSLAAFATFFNKELETVVQEIRDAFLKFLIDIGKIAVVIDNFLVKPINAKLITLVDDFRAGPIGKAINTFFDVFKQTFKFISGALSRAVTLVTGGLTALAPSFDFLKGIAKIFSKLFLPLTIFITAWDTVKGAVEGFQQDGIIGGIEGAVVGFFNSLIFAPLDLIKKATEWLLRKVGLTNVADIIGSFSFEELFEDIVGIVFAPIKTTVNWVKTLFTDPTEALNQLWQGLVGEGGLLDIIYAPVNLAVNFIKDIFNLGDPDQPFRMGAFIESTVEAAINVIKDLFLGLVNKLRSIPILSKFFKTEEEKALEKEIAALEEQLSSTDALLRRQALEAKSANDALLRLGDPEKIKLLGRLPGETLEEARERQRKKQAELQGQLQTIGADRRLIELARSQTGLRLQAAEQELQAAGPPSGGTIVIDNSSSQANSNTNVIGQQAVSAADSYYMASNPLTGHPGTP